MLHFLIRRIALSLFLLWGVLTLSFFLVHMAPGDPVDLLLDPSLPAQDAAAMRHRLGLDRPIHVQYGEWIQAVAVGDLGTSFRQHRPVRDIILEALPLTLKLSVSALLAQYILGCALGIFSAARRSTPAERVWTVLSLALYSMPIFWLGLMLQLLLSYYWRVFPSGGAPTLEFSEVGLLPWLSDQWRHAFLPVFVLAIGGAAGVARYARNSFVEILQQDYIRAARAKGLPEIVVLLKHALRNAAIPLFSLLGLNLPFLLSGSVVTEIIFSWPGMGRVTVDAIYGRDYPVILATTLLSGCMVVLGSLLADLGYAWADPRIRTGRSR
jgi:peptide/nickel transport system permease protein